MILIIYHDTPFFIIDYDTPYNRGSGPLALSGMGEVGLTNGVAVWRPLLSHTKEEIYEFAHK